jgi:hypothetical protein
MVAMKRRRVVLASGITVVLLLAFGPLMATAQERTAARSYAGRDEGLKGTKSLAPVAQESKTTEVIHLANTASGWQSAQTPNFRLWHQQSHEDAERVLVAAERARSRVYEKWFGKDGPTWEVRCELYLYPNRETYRTATGLPDSAPGNAQTTNEGQRIITRRIDLRGDWPDLADGVLPHEVTHIVLAELFVGGPVPCWANEGIAVLNEPADNVAQHLRNLPRHRDEGALYNLRELVELTDYPDPRYLGVFYAQSVSLVQFLVKEKGAAALPEFLRCVRRAGYGPALRRHYGLTFEELEKRWRQHAYEPPRLASVGRK